MQKSIRVKALRKNAPIKKMAKKPRSRKKNVYRDLDDLVGSWSAREGKTFRDALNAARRMDEDLWR